MKLLIVTFLLFSARAEKLPFDAFYAQSLGSCGGRVYANCDAADGLSQVTIFEAGVAEAKNSGRKVLFLVGADWCPFCAAVEETFHRNPDQILELKKDYVVVHIQAQMESGKKIRKLLGAYEALIPRAVYYDPIKDQVSEAFNPFRKSIEELHHQAPSEHPIDWPANR